MIENIRHTSFFPASLLPLRTFLLAENEGEILSSQSGYRYFQQNPASLDPSSLSGSPLLTRYFLHLPFLR